MHVHWTSELASLVAADPSPFSRAGREEAAEEQGGGVSGSGGGSSAGSSSTHSRRISWDLSELAISPDAISHEGSGYASLIRAPPPPSSASSVSSRRSSFSEASESGSHGACSEELTLSTDGSDDGSFNRRRRQSYDEMEEEDDDEDEGADDDANLEVGPPRILAVPGGAAPSATLATLRAAIAASFGVPAAEQRLVRMRGCVPLLLRAPDGAADESCPLSSLDLLPSDEVHVEDVVGGVVSGAFSRLLEKRVFQQHRIELSFNSPGVSPPCAPAAYPQCTHQLERGVTHT